MYIVVNVGHMSEANFIVANYSTNSTIPLLPQLLLWIK